jgi:hypothetical protein
MEAEEAFTRWLCFSSLCGGAGMRGRLQEQGKILWGTTLIKGSVGNLAWTTVKASVLPWGWVPCPWVEENYHKRR